MFVYGFAPAANDTTSGTANTLDAYLAIRVGANRHLALQAYYSTGKGAGLTALSGIQHRCRRWTTAGSGGSAVDIEGRDIGHPAAQATVVNGAYTEGTVDGATAVAFGHGATGPGGWVARDAQSRVMMKGGDGDELSWNSISGTVSLNFEVNGEFEE